MRRREFLAGLGGVVAATAVRGAEAAVAKYGCGYVQFVFTYSSLAQVDGLRVAIERRLRGLIYRGDSPRLLLSPIAFAGGLGKTAAPTQVSAQWGAPEMALDISSALMWYNIGMKNILFAVEPVVIKKVSVK